MAKRQIIAAAKRKGITFAECSFSWQATPEEMVPSWLIVLSDESEDAIAEADSDFNDWQPDCMTGAEVLAWVDSLPDVRALIQQAAAKDTP